MGETCGITEAPNAPTSGPPGHGFDPRPARSDTDTDTDTDDSTPVAGFRVESLRPNLPRRDLCLPSAQTSPGFRHLLLSGAARFAGSTLVAGSGFSASFGFSGRSGVTPSTWL